MREPNNSLKYVRTLPDSMVTAIEKMLGIHCGHGTLHVGGVAAIVFLVLFAIGSYGTFKTGFKGVHTTGLTDEMTAHLQNLPDKWRAETDRRFKAGEISGYERQIEHRRAEAIRQKAEVAAVQIQQMGDEKAKKLMKSAIGQAVVSVLFSSIAPTVFERAASGANPTLIKKAGVLMTKELGKFGTKTLMKGTVKSIDVAQSLIVDQAVSISMDIATGKAPELEKAFLDQHLGMMKLHKELQNRFDNDLMRAHMASVISALDQAQQKYPDGYQDQVQEKAAHLDHFLSLTEQTQKSRGERVKSPWKTVADLSDWMKVQVLAKQKAEAEKQKLQALQPSFDAVPTQGKAPLQVNFDASASTGEIEAYQWDFGDERHGKGSVVNHIYQTPGDYTARLILIGPNGIAKSTEQQIAVVSGEGAITVQLGVAPARVKPGESITIVVNPKVSGIKEGELKIEVAIDGKSITTKQHSGALDGDLSQTLRHPITKQFTGGDHIVKVFAEVRDKPENKPLAATDTKSFHVEAEEPKKKSLSGVDAFVGDWQGVMILHVGGQSLSAPFNMSIRSVSKQQIRINTTSSHPAASPSSEIYKVKGSTATMTKRYVEQGMEIHEQGKLTVVGEGQRLIGSAQTTVYDLGPPRQRMDGGKGSFQAKRVK